MKTMIKEVSSSSTSPNEDESKEAMLESSPNSSKETNDDDYSVETTMSIDEHDED